MKLIGLTGGVGMGKSTAAGFLLAQGASVIDTDEIAREIVAPGQPAWEEVCAEFGREVLLPDGTLNRPLLAQKVFTDDNSRKRLEAILHPRIRERWMNQVQSWRSAGHALAVVVIPLLFETAAEDRFDKIICVACSRGSQYARLRLRDWSEEQICRRIAAQIPVEQKIARSHHVVWSEGDSEVHRRQIARILRVV